MNRLDHIRVLIPDPVYADLYVAAIQYAEEKGGSVDEILGITIIQTSMAEPGQFIIGVRVTGLVPLA